MFLQSVSIQSFLLFLLVQKMGLLEYGMQPLIGKFYVQMQWYILKLCDMEVLGFEAPDQQRFFFFLV